MTDGQVYEVLFPGRGVRESVFAQPDWGRVHRELAKVGGTLRLLHQEYEDAAVRDGQPVMSYDRFCRLYADYARVRGAASRVGHKAGRSVEVDWSGPTMELTQLVHDVLVRRWGLSQQRSELFEGPLKSCQGNGFDYPRGGQGRDSRTCAGSRVSDSASPSTDAGCRR